MYLNVPDFRPRSRISRSGCRRFYEGQIDNSSLSLRGQRSRVLVSESSSLYNNHVMLSERPRGLTIT
ncbi:hypothetical protein ACN38_g7141 [Penicillium nordicum]|uniref:Uncharacterized protein n=1 Tax=Penicillium nordicum TaxID=229535 RepID=A0A0M8NZD7_9EURO|nr:hypothetical protein ACN38_g7141 [Penicillium nordicum]